MPPCEAVGPYAGELRGLLLAYKEKGRYRLARPLGALLAAAVAQAAVRGGGGVGVPLLVLPVPSTARAARQRHGDHLARLAAHTVRALRAAGWQARASSALASVTTPGLGVPGRGGPGRGGCEFAANPPGANRAIFDAE